MKTRHYGLLGAALVLATVLPCAAFAQHHDHDDGRHGDYHHDNHGGWQGDRGHPFPRYDIDRWHSGGWRHEWHDGRLGWWWTVGPQWYYYPAPVYPYPNPYVPPSIPAPVGPMWYYCGAPAGYYPYVGRCSVQWQAVPPR
jgi:hypothetical protein